MTKNESIQYLRHYVQAQERIDKIEEERLYLQSQIKKRKEPPELRATTEEGYLFAGVLSSMIVGIFTIPIMIIIFLFTPLDNYLLDLFDFIAFVEHHPYISDLIFAYIIPTILMLPLWVKVVNTKEQDQVHDSEASQQYQDRLKEIPELERQLQLIPAKMQSAQSQLQQLKSMNIVHPKYLPHSRTLLSYFEEGRADSLKEAINLLEYERKENERDKEIARHHRKMQRQATEHAAIMEAEASRGADAAEEAARSANEAAFWGALTTYETSKIRKKLDE